MRTETELRDALHAAADRALDPDSVFDRLRFAPSSSGPVRRMRPLAVVGIVAAALAVVAAIVVPQLVRRSALVPADPADRRVPGNWAMISHVDPPAGWTPATREVAGTYETTVIADSTGKGFCTIEVDGRGVAPQHAIGSSAESATVAGSSALYQAPAGVAPFLFWHYSADAWASVSCTPGPTKAGVLPSAGEVRDITVRVAESVTFGDYPLRTPVRLAQLPAGIRVQSVREDDTRYRYWSVVLADASTGTPISVRPAGGTIPATNADVGSRPASFFTYPIYGPPQRIPRKEVSYTSLCVPSAPIPMCMSTSNTITDDPETHRAPFLALASGITYAPSATDTSTWFDANEAFPR